MSNTIEEAQAGKKIEWMEKAIDLAVQWADLRSDDSPTADVVGAFNAMREHFLTALSQPAVGAGHIPAQQEVPQSYVLNCHIKPREGDGPLFFNDTHGHPVVQLDGYSITPLPAQPVPAAVVSDDWPFARLLVNGVEVLGSGHNPSVLSPDDLRALAARINATHPQPAQAGELIQTLQRLGSDFPSHPVSRSIDDCEAAGAAMMQASRELSASPKCPRHGIYMCVSCMRSAQAGEPVAFVPVHPRSGPLWMDTYAAGIDPSQSRPKSYPVMPLYASPFTTGEPAGAQAGYALLRKGHLDLYDRGYNNGVMDALTTLAAIPEVEKP